MPYIPFEDRKPVLHVRGPLASGELNFKLTNVIVEYMRVKGLNYQTINDIMGALEGAKMEFYRRVAVPYEQKKISENGDVYPKEVTA